MPAQHRAAPLGRRYWTLWSSTAVSTFGDGLALVAFPLVALTMTHRAVSIAGVAVALESASFFVAPLVGALVDRYNRRRLAQSAEFLRLGAFAAFGSTVVLGVDTLWLLYLTAMIIGCCQVVYSSCAVAALPTVVRAKDLERANGHLEAAMVGSRELAGQGIGGVAFAVAGSLPFVLDAAAFAVSAVVVRRFVPETARTTTTTSIRRDITEGFRWFAGHSSMRTMGWLIGTFALFQSAVMSVLVLYATGALHAGRAGFGLLMAVGSVGSIVGSVLVSPATRRLGAFQLIVVGGALAGSAYLLLAARASVLTAGIALALECAGVSIGNIASISIRQRLIPNEMLGRAGTTFRMWLMGASVLGAFLGGVGTSLLGLRQEFALAGTLQLLAVTFALTKRRRFRLGAPAGPLVDLTTPLAEPAPRVATTA